MTEHNKYNSSKIYKICSNLTDNIYIGSTTQSLSQRLSEHVRRCNHYIKIDNNYISSFEIIKLGDYYITLIEECNFCHSVIMLYCYIIFFIFFINQPKLLNINYYKVCTQ